MEMKLNLLKLGRLQKNLNQEKLAKLSGIKRWKITFCERGLDALTKTEHKKLCKVVGLNKLNNVNLHETYVVDVSRYEI